MGNRQNHQDQFFDFYRVGLKATADLINGSLEAAERLRKQQLAAINQGLVSRAVVVAEIDPTKLIEELIAVPGKLARLQYQALLCYWNGVFHGAGESPAEVAPRVQVQARKIRESFKKDGSPQAGSR